MEKLGIESEREQLKSFDLMAPIDLMRYDLQFSGAVQQETRQRNYNESLTFIAEGINRPLNTEFNLKNINGKLSYFDRGQWRPYAAMLITGMEVAQQEAVEDPRKQFQADRATSDWHIGLQFEGLKPGEHLNWYSPYPQKEEDFYGDKFIAGLGYNPARKMGFLYQAIKSEDGSLTLHSQSVDNSDDQAFEAAMRLANQNPNAGIQDIRAAYDGTLSSKHEGRFFAGRKLGVELSEENAWETIQKHQDLISFYFDKIENLSRDVSSTREQLEHMVKRLTYGVWAALKERMDRGAVHIMPTGPDYPQMNQLQIQIEVSRAFKILSGRGEVLLGCGGSISGNKDILDADPEDVFDSVFGKDEDEYGSLTFKCEKGHQNRRPRKKLIDNCKTCGVSVKC